MNPWDRRIERALALQREFPPAADLLSFYREIAAFQKTATGDRRLLLGLIAHHAPNASPDAAQILADRVLEQCVPADHVHDRPLCSVLRPEGDGGKRSLVCGVCFAEWEFNRIRCPGCGEADEQKLPVYVAAQFTWVRIEACDTCRSYLKSIDMTKNGHAVPEVDEIASVALDIWAAEQGYSKLCPNLFGL